MIATINDPKRWRTASPPDDKTRRFCKECNRYGRHSTKCSKATIEDYAKDTERAEEDEEWARQRATYWLDQVRLMHGKLSLLKHENRVLRRKLKAAREYNEASKQQ